MREQIFNQLKHLYIIFAGNLSPRPAKGQDILDFWRQRVVFALLLGGVIVGGISVLAVVPILFGEGLWGLILFDLCTWLSALVMLVSQRISIQVKMGFCLSALYITGVVVIANVGVLSGGPAMLFCFAVLAGILFGAGAAFLALLANALTLGITAWLITSGVWGAGFPFFESRGLMVTGGINFILFNGLTAVSVSLLVQGLLLARKKENELTRSLVESNERFHSLADAAMEAILFVQNGLCLQVNETAVRLFGYEKASDFIGFPLKHLISDRYQGMAAMEDRMDISRESEGLHRNGSRFPVIVRSRAMTLGEHGPVSVLTIEDITEKKRSEKINRTLFAITNAVNLTRDLNDLFSQIQHLLGKVLDTTNFYIALVDTKDRLIRFSYFMDEMEIATPDPAPLDADDSLTGLLAREKKPMMLLRRDLERLDGQKNVQGPLPMIWMGVPLMIQDEGIGVTAVQSYRNADLYDRQDLDVFAAVSDQIAVAIDRKRSEDLLKESEKKYRHLFDNAPSPIYEIDFLRSRFTSVNDAMCHYSGYSKAEFLAMNPLDLLTRESRKAFYEQFQGLDQHRPVSQAYDFQIRKKSGEILSVVLSTDFVYENGKVTGARVVVHDITERKKMEELMVRSEKMMSVGGLAAGMAHEINNPLAGMIQNAQVIHSRLSRKLPANLRTAEELGLSMDGITAFMERRGIFRQIANINEAGSRAARIVENMLSFAGDKGGTKVLCRMDQLLADTISLAKKDYDLKKKHHIRQMTIKTEISPDLPEVRCEESKIQQVFFNLIRNACEAMAGNPDMATSPLLVCRVRPQGPDLCIEFEDNGPGMDAATRKRVFEPFFTTKGVNEGTGLGLAISYYIIVEDHGGQMDIRSEPGQGACFAVTLPAAG